MRSVETSLGHGKARDAGRATPELAILPGARMLRESEPEKNSRLAEAMIKLVTGGEPIQARHLNRALSISDCVRSRAATSPHSSSPSGFGAALSLAANEASARACAWWGSAASEVVTSWGGSARKPPRACVSSLPGLPSAAR